MIGFEDMALYVCQSEDDDYYASHRFDGNEDAAGMIYLDFQGSLWPASDNMVPVSYTHLDVYKRQRHRHVRICECLAVNQIGEEKASVVRTALGEDVGLVECLEGRDRAHDRVVEKDRSHHRNGDIEQLMNAVATVHFD